MKIRENTANQVKIYTSSLHQPVLVGELKPCHIQLDFYFILLNDKYDTRFDVMSFLNSTQMLLPSRFHLL
jgi:hypothetical protein